MKRFLLFFFLLLASGAASAACTPGASGKCEVGAGKTYTTIQACATAATAGQTCLIFAGTYNEAVLLSTNGSSGNLITFQNNASDVVNVYCFNVQANFVKIHGLVFTDPALTHCSGGGVDVPNANNNITIESNTFTQVGSGPCIFLHGSTPPSFVTISSNVISWCSSNPGGVSTAPSTGIEINGDHLLIQNNVISHTPNGMSGTFSHSIIRGNTCGPTNDPVDFSGTGYDTHYDCIEVSTPSSATGFNVSEKNNENNIVGIGGAHFYITNTAGTNMIDRFNTSYSVGTGYAGLNGNSTNISNWMMYNNSVVGSCTQQANCGMATWVNAPGGAFINNLFYNSANNGGTADGYYNVDTPSLTGFVSSTNLAFDSACTPSTLANCTSTPFKTATGSTWANPSLVATNSTSFAVQANSPARGAGIPLTTVNGSISASTTLVVANAAFFQDGYTITGVSGDCIRVTSLSNPTVCITAVNYATNTLTLASPITATNGDSVWLASISDGTRVLTDPNGVTLGALPYLPASTGFCGVSGDTAIHQPPNYDTFVPPAVGQSYVDPVFGCTITRLTDSINFPGSQACTNTTCQGKHFYSTVVPDNADHSLVMITLNGLPAIISGPAGTHGTPGTILVKQSNFPTSNLTSQGFVMWDIVNPLVFYYTSTNNFNSGTITGLPGCIATNSCTITTNTLATASSYTAIALMDDEDISEDGMHLYVGAHVGAGINDASCNTSGVLCDVLPITLSATGGSGTATIGAAVLTGMYWHKLQAALSNRFNLEAPNGVNTFTEYNTNGSTYGTLPVSHHDFIHNLTNGNEDVVSPWNTGTANNICPHENGAGSSDTASLTMLVCLLEVATPGNSGFGIPPGIAAASHFSTRDMSLGWALYEAESYGAGACPNSVNPYCEPGVSQTTNMANWGLYDGELILFKIDGSQIIRLAHHRSRSGTGYWAGSRGVITRDAKYVYFDSNQDSCTFSCGSQTTTSDPNYTDLYVISLQPAPTTSVSGIGELLGLSPL